MLKPHVVILGAGFGGVYVAKRLKRLVKRGEIELTIVNRTNYFLFTPLLHEVAAGSLSPASVAEPVREIFKGCNVKFCQGSIESIDVANRCVNIRGVQSSGANVTNGFGGGKHSIQYDYLVIATGAETNYYNIPGAEQFSMPLKTLSDAVKIRSRVIDSFEGAALCDNPEEKLCRLSFAVVGGGPTGVELAAELKEFVRELVARYYGAAGCLSQEPQISLIEIGTELLSRFPLPLRQAATARLRENGVNLHLGNKVAAVTPKGITLSNNTTIPASTVIWTVGVKPAIPTFEGFVPELVAGRLAVDEYFRVGGDERVFALGDVAAYVNSSAAAAGENSPPRGACDETEELLSPRGRGVINKQSPVPMLAQAAVQEAKIVAHNILASIQQRKLRSFNFHPKGTLVSVGEWFAVGEILSTPIVGRFAWWLWRTVYLFNFASWKKRLRIASEWTLNLFYPRDITKFS